MLLSHASFNVNGLKQTLNRNIIFCYTVKDVTLLQETHHFCVAREKLWQIEWARKNLYATETIIVLELLFHLDNHLYVR